MNDTAIDAESRALAVVTDEPRHQVALFGTNDPVDIVRQATRVADALKEIIVKKGLVSNIQGKQYPQVEAWQCLATMLGLAAVCEWTREVPDGWEARVVVQRNGLTIAAAEAQCTRTEKTWKSRDAYALRSMAQTRAISKSLRSVLGFVMVLSGFQPTPAEEMPHDEKPAPSRPAAPDDSARKMGVEAIRRYCAKHGLKQPPTEGKSVDELRAIYEGLVAARKVAQGAQQPPADPEPSPAPQTPPAAQETPATGNGNGFPPAHDGIAATPETFRRLFALLGELGYKEKEARLGFASSFGLSLTSYSQLSDGQAEWLTDRARSELLALRAQPGDNVWRESVPCPGCETAPGDLHAFGCPQGAA